MSVYVDTSAFLAVLDADDENHEAAKKVWTDLLESREAIVCNSYVLMENLCPGAAPVRHGGSEGFS